MLQVDDCIVLSSDEDIQLVKQILLKKFKWVQGLGLCTLKVYSANKYILPNIYTWKLFYFYF